MIQFTTTLLVINVDNKEVCWSGRYQFYESAFIVAPRSIAIVQMIPYREYHRYSLGSSSIHPHHESLHNERWFGRVYFGARFGKMPTMEQRHMKCRGKDEKQEQKQDLGEEWVSWGRVNQWRWVLLERDHRLRGSQCHQLLIHHRHREHYRMGLNRRAHKYTMDKCNKWAHQIHIFLYNRHW